MQRADVTLLYRCPPRCYGVDFFILSPDDECAAIQTSISGLTKHASDSGGVAVSLPAMAAVFEMPSFTRYIFITVSPDRHTDLAKLPSLNFVRLVKASTWIGT